jgi:hypothetical protein
VIREMPGPTGLPDAVAVPITSAMIDRLELGVPALLAQNDARLAAACGMHRPRSLAALAKRLGMGIEPTAQRARRLCRSGALIISGNGFVRPDALAPIGRLYALEAKVDDWSGGLRQALRYGSWADASGAVIGHLPDDRTVAVRQASILGLGLALAGRWLVRPQIRALPFGYRLWASEHVVAALAGNAQAISEIARYHNDSASA